MPTPLNRAKKEEIAKKVLMPGDPLHAKIIAQSMWSESSYARTQNGYEVDILFPDPGLNKEILQTTAYIDIPVKAEAGWKTWIHML